MVQIAEISHRKLTPANAITFLGMVLAIWGYALVLERNVVIATIVLTLAALTDLCDGFVAKNKKIVEFFRGIGKSFLGKTIDPIRDTILKGIAFPIAYIIDPRLLLFPLAILIMHTLGVYYCWGRRINKLEGGIFIHPTSRWLMLGECLLLGLWFLDWNLSSSTIELHKNTIELFTLLVLSTLVRFFIYGSYYLKRKEEEIKNKKIKSIF